MLAMAHCPFRARGSQVHAREAHMWFCHCLFLISGDYALGEDQFSHTQKHSVTSSPKMGPPCQRLSFSSHAFASFGFPWSREMVSPFASINTEWAHADFWVNPPRTGSGFLAKSGLSTLQRPLSLLRSLLKGALILSGGGIRKIRKSHAARWGTS